MKQPNLRDLQIDRAGTRKIHAAAKAGSVKITINIDRDSLTLLRAMAEEAGVPYQRLLNTVLQEGLRGQEPLKARVDRLERALKKMQRQSAA
jgi:predicted DNA binding CopG/RHH family protein